MLCLVILGCGSDPSPSHGLAPGPTEPAELPRSATSSALPYEPDREPDLVVGQDRYWADTYRGLIARADGDAAPGVLLASRSAPGHLAASPSGTVYWVEYRREDARCDFIRLEPDDSARVLFEDALGDYSEQACDTDLAVDDGHLYWLHFGEVRAADASPGAPARTLVRGEAYPWQLVLHGAHLYWVTFGADPYEEDTTGTGALRAMPRTGGAVIEITGHLTEANHLSASSGAITFEERAASGVIARRFPFLE